MSMPQQDMTPGPGKLTQLGNGHVVRLHRCDCGTAVYKKDLTDNTYAVLNRDRRYTIIDAGDQCKIKCPNPTCYLWHVVLTVRVNISIVDKFDAELGEAGVQ